MPHRDAILASDTDRDTVADRLRHAAQEGRLTTEELESRLARAFSSRTYGDLDALMADLPVPSLPLAGRARRTTTRRTASHPVAVVALLAAALAAVAVLLTVLLAVGVLLLSGWLGWVVIAWAIGGRRRHCARGSLRLARPPHPTMTASRRAGRRRGGYLAGFTPRP